MGTQEYGGSRQEAVVVGVASVVIVRGNTLRKELVIANDSVGTIYLADGADAIVNTGGKRLAPGGTIVYERDTEGYIWKGDVRAISTLAACNVGFTESW